MTTTPTRRVVLGAGLAGSAALVVGAPSASATPATAATPAASPGVRHILFRGWKGPSLLEGQRAGTRWFLDGLRIARATGTRDYVDPFGDGSSVRYEEASWTSPPVTSRFPLNELISSWNAITPGRTWIEVLARGTDETGMEHGWFVLGRWCEKDPADGGAIHRTSVDDQGTARISIWTDTLHVDSPHTFTRWQLKVNLLRPSGTALTPTVRFIGAVTSGLPDAETVPVSPVGRARGRVLPVPTFSQEVHIGHYPQWDNGGEAWCSATSTAMVLKYWRTGPRGADLAWVDPPVDAEVDVAARNVFDYTYDGAGNWPFNTAYAARYGLEGFVTRLRSFTELEELVRVGIPVIISVSFEKGDLDGAGYGTNGHLMVVVGFTQSGHVVVNDPASHLVPDNGQVRATYRREQLENAWVPHSGGTVYVIHPRWLPLPPVLTRGEPNW